MLQNRNMLSCWTSSWPSNIKTFFKMCLPVICLFLILMDGAYGSGFGSCPKHSLMSNFNITKLKGEWFVYGKTYGWLESASDCIEFRFGSKGKLQMWIENMKTGSPTVRTGYVTQERSLSPLVYFHLDHKYEGLYQFLYTDYSNYAIFWACDSWGWLCYFDQIWVIVRQNLQVNSQYSAVIKKFHLDPGRLYLSKNICSKNFGHSRR